jgi:hypothetical protein
MFDIVEKRVVERAQRKAAIFWVWVSIVNRRFYLFIEGV